MYGIFTYIYPKNHPNVGIYTIHGAYGNVELQLGRNRFGDVLLKGVPLLLTRLREVVL